MSQGDHGDMPGMSPGSTSDNTTKTMSSSDMIMRMSFYWGKEVVILFSGWPNHNTDMYVLAFFFVFFLAVSIEVLSVPPAVGAATIRPLMAAFVTACVYALKMGFAYMVMLSVMSYNLGIFIAAVAGHTIGHFIVKARALAVAHKHDQNDSAPKV